MLCQVRFCLIKILGSPIKRFKGGFSDKSYSGHQGHVTFIRAEFGGDRKRYKKFVTFGSQ